MKVSLRTSPILLQLFCLLCVLAIFSSLACTKKGDEKAGANGGDKKRIVFLTNGDDPFWDACRKGMDDAAKQLKIEDAGLTHTMDKGSEFNAEKQIDKLKQYATQTDIAAVAISPVDKDNSRLADALKTLRDRGVKVICVDSDMDAGKFADSRFAYLGTDNLTGGRELGKTAKGLMPDGAKYAQFVGLKTVANAQDRMNGFAEGAGEKFEEIDRLADNGDHNEAQENVKTVLKKHPKTNLLVGIWAYNAHAIVKVVEDREVRDKTKIVVFDAAPLALTDIEQGKIDAMVVQNPYQMGELTVKLVKALIEDDHKAIGEIFPGYDVEAKKFKTADGNVFNTDLRVVVPDEESPLKKEMFDPKTKFFYYKDFKKWLDERGLVSS
jgi:ribose transport system substrate-binding protein